MNLDIIGPVAAALGVGAILQAIAARILGRPAATGADGRLADAQADKARAETDALAWESMRAQMDRLASHAEVLAAEHVAMRERIDAQGAELADVRQRLAERDIQIADLTQQLTTARVQLDHWREVESSDKRRIAELEGRVAELEAAQRGYTEGSGNASAKDGR